MTPTPPVQPITLDLDDRGHPLGHAPLVVRKPRRFLAVELSARSRGRLDRSAFRTATPRRSPSEAFLRAFAPFWNLLIPKHAVGASVGPDPERKGAVRYLHATKGWRTISKARLSSLGFAV